ncbi:MAG: aminoglycoside phosphotransferase family protein [Pseudomonadota bacterium]
MDAETVTDPRRDRLVEWLAEVAPGSDLPQTPLAADASFRRYFRVATPEGPRVAMDAPPEHEEVLPFWRVADLLREAGLSAPAVVTGDPARGFLLLEDLGDQTMSRALDSGADPEPLYARAVDTLVHLQRTAGQPNLPEYGRDRLLAECALLVDWFHPAVTGEPCPPAARSAWFEAWEAALDGIGDLPATIVLRDYHADNLMVLPERDGVAACGLLDFQDAVLGSPAYDLVSLLRDARRDVDPELAARMEARFLAGRPELDGEAFARACRTLSAQRNTKILGIFTRLARRDGKPGYLDFLPRVRRLLAEELAAPELAPVADWFRAHLPLEQATVEATA